MGVDEDVRGFEVAVDDAVVVGVGDGAADLEEDIEGAIDGDFFGAEETAEVATGDAFGDEGEPAVGGGGDVEDGEDVRVVERSHDFGFGFEAEVVGGRGSVAGDFDDALFGGVDASGEPELGHAAGAEEPEDFPAVDGGWEEGW